ncbi:MAG: hypothetical protein GY938_27670, partial [Ketobacter sp.]|nr:hypothetical protein [Ketobacter sp.]
KSLRDSSRQLGRQDSLNLRYKGAQEARNFEIQAQDFKQREANARRKGTNALLKSYLAGSVGLIGSSKAVRKASLFVPVPSKRPRRFA